MRDLAYNTTMMVLVVDHITEQGQDPDMVFTSSIQIVKASLNFTGKFWYAVLKSHIWPTHTDNILTLDCTILVASILDGYDIT